MSRTLQGRRRNRHSRRGNTVHAAVERSTSSRQCSFAPGGEGSLEQHRRLSDTHQPPPQRRRGPAPRPGSAQSPSTRNSFARPQRAGVNSFRRVGRALVMGGRIGPPVVLAAYAAEGFTTSNAQLSDHAEVERVHVPKADLGAEPQSTQCSGSGGSAAGPDSPDALRCSMRHISRRSCTGDAPSPDGAACDTSPGGAAPSPAHLRHGLSMRHISRRPSVAELVQQSKVRCKSRPASAKLFHRAAALHGFLARIQPGEIEGDAQGALDQKLADEVGEQAFDPASLPLFRDAPAAVQAEVATALQVLADQPALLGNLTDGEIEIEPSEAQLLKAVSAALDGARHGWRKDARRRWRAARLAVGFACRTTQPLQLLSPPSGTPSMAGGDGRNRLFAAVGSLPQLSPPPSQLPPPNVWQRLSKPARKYASVSPEGGDEAQGRPPPAEETLPECMRHGVSCVPARPSSQSAATPPPQPTPQQLHTRRSDEGVRAEPDWDALGAATAARDPDSAEQALALMRQLSPTYHHTSSPGTPIVPAAFPSREEPSTPSAGPADVPEARRGFRHGAPRLPQSEAEALFARLSSPLAASHDPSVEASVSAAVELIVAGRRKASVLSQCAVTSCTAASTPPASKRESPATRASPLRSAAGSSVASGGSSPPKPSSTQAGRKPRYMLGKEDRMAFYKCANSAEGCGCHGLRNPPGA
jgi:hypothetical protein